MGGRPFNKYILIKAKLEIKLKFLELEQMKRGIQSTLP